MLFYLRFTQIHKFFLNWCCVYLFIGDSSAKQSLQYKNGGRQNMRTRNALYSPWKASIFFNMEQKWTSLTERVASSLLGNIQKHI